MKALNDFIPDDFSLTNSEWEVFRNVAEFYAQSKANEAVKEAKYKIRDFIVYNRLEKSLTLEQILDSAPLPYPDEQ